MKSHLVSQLLSVDLSLLEPDRDAGASHLLEIRALRPCARIEAGCGANLRRQPRPRVVRIGQFVDVHFAIRLNTGQQPD